MPPKIRKKTDLKKLNELRLKYMSEINEESKILNSGVGNRPRPNYNPVPNVADNEINYGNQEAGALISCGSDRPGNILSGYGGAGEQNSGRIRMTCGPHGHYKKSVDEDGNILYAEPSNDQDAATFYLSEKSDIDDDWNYANGTAGNIKNRSAAVLHADSTRISSRGGGVKIVAGTSNDEGRVSVPNIDLIVNNDDSQLQPIPKGENLRKSLVRLNKQIQDLTNIVSGFLESQMQFNAVLAQHMHPTLPAPVVAPVPVPGTPIGATTVGSTTMSPEVVAAGTIAASLQGGLTAPSLSFLATNSAFFEMNYFKNRSSETYINSRNVNTT